MVHPGARHGAKSFSAFIIVRKNPTFLRQFGGSNDIGGFRPEKPKFDLCGLTRFHFGQNRAEQIGQPTVNGFNKSTFDLLPTVFAEAFQTNLKRSWAALRTTTGSILSEIFIYVCAPCQTAFRSVHSFCSLIGPKIRNQCCRIPSAPSAAFRTIDRPTKEPVQASSPELTALSRRP